MRQQGEIDDYLFPPSHEAVKSAVDNERILREMEIRRRQHLARRLFGQDENPERNADLRDWSLLFGRFCRAFESTFDPNPLVSARLDGRREAWQFVADYRLLTYDDLYRKYHSGG